MIDLKWTNSALKHGRLHSSVNMWTFYIQLVCKRIVLNTNISRLLSKIRHSAENTQFFIKKSIFSRSLWAK